MPGKVEIGAVLLLFTVTACQTAVPPEPSGQEELTRITLRACTGPAVSLSPDRKETLQSRLSHHPDHRRANIAETTPGGFAGFLFTDGEPVIMLTRPDEESAAKAALAPLFPDFPIQAATVRRARWDFAQLVDWYDYLTQRTELWSLNVTMGDKSESDNRIVFGVRDNASLKRVQDLLLSVPIPCDLVILTIRQPVELL